MSKPIPHKAWCARALSCDKSGDRPGALHAWLMAAETAGRYDQEKREMCGREAVRVFDKLYQAGIDVEFWPMAREGEGRRGKTKGAPYMLCGTAMIGIEGVAGGIALSHVRIISEVANA